MLSALVVMFLFGQNLADINYNFIKKDIDVALYKPQQNDNRYEYTCNLKFLTKNKIQNPLDKNKDTIFQSRQTTVKLSNCEVFTDFKIRSTYYPETKTYYYRMYSFGYVKPYNNIIDNKDYKSYIIQATAKAMSELKLDTSNIKIDILIPMLKTYTDGQIIDAPKLN